MPRRRRRKAKATAISLLILAVTVGLAMCLPFVLAHIAHTIRAFLGYPVPMEFDLLLIGMAFLGFAFGVIVIVGGLLKSIRFWLRYTAPFDGALCTKCGYNLAGTYVYTNQCPECGHWNGQNPMPPVRPHSIQIVEDGGATSTTNESR